MADLLEANEIMFTQWEPKMANRFVMYIDGIPSFLIKAASRPKITLNTTVIDHININRKLKGGKTNWEDLSITLYDAVTPSGAQAAMEWIRLSHESVSGRDGYSDFYKKDVTINILGPVGDKVEEWTLKGAFVTSMEGGTLDWGTGDPLLVNLTIAMDYCILQF